MTRMRFQGVSGSWVGWSAVASDLSGWLLSVWVLSGADVSGSALVMPLGGVGSDVCPGK